MNASVKCPQQSLIYRLHSQPENESKTLSEFYIFVGGSPAIQEFKSLPCCISCSFVLFSLFDPLCYQGKSQTDDDIQEIGSSLVRRLGVSLATLDNSKHADLPMYLLRIGKPLMPVPFLCSWHRVGLYLNDRQPISLCSNSQHLYPSCILFMHLGP